MLATRNFGNLIRAAGATRLKHTLPELPYEYSALEPVISREIMSLHHSKHHATYINNLNAAEEKLVQAQTKGDIETVISLAPALKFNGGGHINHTIFWQNLSPKSSKPSDVLIKAIEKDFGSLENMKNQLAAASVGVQGSGWGWLGYNKQMKKLQIATCQNQDPLQATTGFQSSKRFLKHHLHESVLFVDTTELT
ncbi:Superoxide dismutase [Mn], mitochondrial [Papilio xuthus]|uniref:Superoxide dismutase n=1 Tax=Papilio xuthus TaxID=66420 RepID=A0A194QAA7_PAPXU|nr:Superoxide dismutase [Mn], mitochondrial [Papilio xuthus]